MRNLLLLMIFGVGLAGAPSQAQALMKMAPMAKIIVEMGVATSPLPFIHVSEMFLGQADVTAAPVSTPDVQPNPAVAATPDVAVAPATEAAPAVAPDVVDVSSAAAVAEPEAPVQDVVAPDAAAPATLTDAETGNAVEKALDFAKEGKWAAFTGVLLMLLVVFLRKYNVLASVPKHAVPWVTTGFGLLTSVGLYLTGMDLNSALTQGIGGGLLAIPMWEMGGKHFLPKPAPTK